MTKLDSRPTRALKWIIDQWSNHPSLDYVLVAIPALIYALLRATETISAAVVVDASTKAVVYQTVAGCEVGFLAFVIVPISIVLALAPGPRLQTLLRHHGDGLRKSLMSALWMLIVGAAVSIVAIAFDAGSSSSTVTRYLAAGTAAIAFLRIVRVVDLFGSLMVNVNKDLATGRASLQPIPEPTSPSDPAAPPRNRATG